MTWVDVGAETSSGDTMMSLIEIGVYIRPEPVVLCVMWVPVSPREVTITACLGARTTTSALDCEFAANLFEAECECESVWCGLRIVKCRKGEFWRIVCEGIWQKNLENNASAALL